MHRLDRRLGRPLPPALPPAPAPSAFSLCPCALSPFQVELYHWAYAQAVEVARPALPERDLLACWN